MLYSDHEGRRQLSRERAESLAEEYRRAQRLEPPSRRERTPASRALSLLRLLRDRSAQRASADRA